MAAATEEVKLTNELSKFVNEWRDKPGNLIMILHKVQEEYGYIPREVALHLSKDLGVPLAKMYGIISFYHFFKLKKPGKNKISVCMGTACYLKGGEDLLLELEKILGVGVNTVTPDGLFSVEAVRCVGCCGLAPVITINGDVYGRLKTDGLAEIVAKYRNVQMHFCITDFLADIVENAINAGSRRTRLSVVQEEGNITITVADTGKGMTEEELRKAQDPFYTDGVKHPGRKIGLGLPFLIQTIGITSGAFSIASSPGKGTTVTFRFDLAHLDTPPLGNLPKTFRQILTLPGDYEMIIDRTRGESSYRVSRSEMIETLGELDSAGSQNLLSTYLESLESEEDS